MHGSSAGTIGITVFPHATGRCVCEIRTSPEVGIGATKRFHGQTAKHAIANALEDVARALRQEAEARQNVGWEAVNHSPSGDLCAKRFHVIVHYERRVDDESKFEAMHNTLLGNTVVENAEMTIIHVDPDFPELAWKARYEK